MATSLDALNNVGPKFRYRVAIEERPGGPVDVFVTQEFANSLGNWENLIQGDDRQNIQQPVRPHIRRQYPGDTTTISVKAHTRVRSIGGTAFNNTLPGKTAYFGVVNEAGVRDQKEIQFQFVGTFNALLTYFPTLIDIRPAENEFFYLRSPNGVPKLIEATGTV